jgi:predicted  nucleic acid-binding Zn-ribbon protein
LDNSLFINDINDLKIEISKMKNIILNKDQTIRQLKDRIGHLEKLEIIVKNKAVKDRAQSPKVII